MNQLFYGDNLQVLRENIADESVDLIYLDPPFNSNARATDTYRLPAVPTVCRAGAKWPVSRCARRSEAIPHAKLLRSTSA